MQEDEGRRRRGAWFKSDISGTEGLGGNTGIFYYSTTSNAQSKSRTSVVLLLSKCGELWLGFLCGFYGGFSSAVWIGLELMGLAGSGWILAGERCDVSA